MIEQLKYWYRAMRYRFRVDPVEISYIIQQLEKGDTAVDIGCHKGGYLYWMERSVGATGHCYAFEPQPTLFQYLQQIKQLKGWGNVTLEPKGVSAQAGSFELHIPRTSSGTSPGATINTLTGTDHETVAIETVTIDGYFFEKGIHPKLMKIDVEGHELEVLKGGQQLFQQVRPRILMECENRHLQGHTVLDVFAQLEEWGYQGQFINQGTIRPLSQFDPEKHQHQGEGRFWEAPDYANNFIFE
jgi:FkbM family methyltransferase